MAEAPRNPITQLLARWRDGDRDAFDQLVPLVYRELRHIAARYLNGERAGHTLQSTALVNEAYSRMVQQELPELQNRAHFFAVAAQVMRQILVDHARSRRALKRGGDAVRVSLDYADGEAVPLDGNLIALDEALSALAQLDPQQGRVVELKFFGGLSNEEASSVLQISVSTVKRDWTVARAWLHRELTQAAE
jgi:RNA polymerase sigma factor (TIGR02999 family)